MITSAARLHELEMHHDLPGLLTALENGNADTRRLAAAALGRLCDDCLAEALGRQCRPCSYGPLCRAAEDRDTTVREAAIDALEKIRPPHTLGIP
jgi:HEAT repeat protein